MKSKYPLEREREKGTSNNGEKKKYYCETNILLNFLSLLVIIRGTKR